jgi:hypothetical protein
MPSSLSLVGSFSVSVAEGTGEAAPEVWDPTVGVPGRAVVPELFVPLSAAPQLQSSRLDKTIIVINLVNFKYCFLR